MSYSYSFVLFYLLSDYKGITRALLYIIFTSIASKSIMDVWQRRFPQSDWHLAVVEPKVLHILVSLSHSKNTQFILMLLLHLVLAHLSVHTMRAIRIAKSLKKSFSTSTEKRDSTFSTLR